MEKTRNAYRVLVRNSLWKNRERNDLKELGCEDGKCVELTQHCAWN
jgi:hypothetical protein